MENKTNRDAFNIYYLNLSKVYEIAMMINNVIIEHIEKERGAKKETYKINKASIDASLNTNNSLAGIKSYLADERGSSKVVSDKLVETLSVKTTKSILLREIEKRCKEYDEKQLKEGDLVKITDVQLDIFDKENLREVQLLRKDALKGFMVQGFDVNNLVTGVLSDYCYLLKGKINDEQKEIIIKIPMEVSNEFENKYSVYDLLIGKVAIIGVFKECVEIDKISDNMYQYLVKKGKDNIPSSKVLKSNAKCNQNIKKEKTKNDGGKYNFIDVIGIIQDIKFKEKTIEKKWYQKIINKILNRKG